MTLFLWAALAGPAQAHDLWLEPASTTLSVGDQAHLTVRVGAQLGDGEAAPAPLACTPTEAPSTCAPWAATATKPASAWR